MDMAGAEIARSFVAARQQDLVLDQYPGDMPDDLDSAYAIQEQAITLNGKPVGGWKVGRVPADLIGKYGTNRLSGPIFADQIVEAGGGTPAMKLLGGFAAVEGEILIRMRSVPETWDTLKELAGHVRDIRLGIEIASSPFTGINRNGPAVTISDFGNNYGLVVGPELAGWDDSDWMRITMQTFIDDELIAEGALADMLDGPFGAVAFLIENLHSRGHTLGPDDVVSTGAVTGVHEIGPGQSARVRFGDLGEVVCRTVPFHGATMQHDAPETIRASTT